MITQPFGLPLTSLPVSVSKLAWFGFHCTCWPTLPPSDFHWATKSLSSAVPNASLRAPTLIVAPLPKASIAAWPSTLPCSVSDGYVRNRGPCP